MFPGPSGRGGAYGQWKRDFPPLLRRLGLPAGKGIDQLCAHSLRHTQGRALADAGVNQKGIEAAGGWRSPKAAAGYIKVSDTGKHQRAASAAMRARLPESVLSDTPSATMIPEGNEEKRVN